MASSTEFAELLARTNGSFLEGASHPDEMIAAAKAKGLVAIGVADRDGLYGIVKAHVAAKSAGMPLLIGARMTIDGIAAPVALIAKSQTGYSALCGLITTGRMRSPKGTSRVTLEEAASCARCWAISTSFLRGQHETRALTEETARLHSVFGDALSIAVARHHAPGDAERFARADGVARECGVALVATNEPYFHHPARRELHDVLTAIREKTTVAALGRRALPNAEWFVKGAEEMQALFGDRPEAIERTVEIARGCTATLDAIRYRYPDEWLPKNFTAMEWLRHLVGEGTRARYPKSRFPRGTPDEVARQLGHELQLIEQLDFAPYFLTVWDIVRFAREKKILCQGRGSAANSAVCFVLGITSIDPVRMSLLFERFISAERGEPPDIDVDFEHERREEVIQYIYEKYGRHRAAMVANLITYRERMSVREVGKALGLAESQIERIATIAGERDLDWRADPDAPGPEALGYSGEEESLARHQTAQIPVDARAEIKRGERGRYRGARPSSDWHDVAPEDVGPFPGRTRARAQSAKAEDPELEMRLPDAEGDVARKARIVTTPEELLKKQGLDIGDRTLIHVMRLTRELLGFPRHLGIHSGGFAITHGPIHELIPTENATMPGRTVVEFDKEDLAAVGILKIDVLALGMLTMIRKALDLLREHEGLDLDLATIPAEDPATYDMICEADTVGVFQIESRAQMNMLPRLLPRSFYDLVIEVALIRPGPITGGMVQPLLRRRRGEEPVTFAHPILEPILKRTYGVPVFQEQAIKLAVAVAGFSPGEAEELRRSMTHKRSKERMEALHDRLLSGMHARGIPTETAETIVSQLSGFAGYGFPESHSASFALLVYASSWIKCHHPAVFCAAILNSQPMGFYAPHTLISDAQHHGVAVNPVDVTKSRWDCTLENLQVRIGYRYVRGLSSRVKETLEKTAPFSSWDDMVTRARLPRDAMAKIAAADAFRSFGLSRRDALWMALRLPPDEDEVFPDGGHGETPGRFSFPALDGHGSMLADYDATGFSTIAHPVSFLRADFQRRGVLDSRALSKARHRSHVLIGGMAIVRQRPPTAGNVVFMTLEDEWGFLNLVIRPEIYDHYRSLCRDSLFVVCEGTVERQGRAINVQAERFEAAVLDDSVSADPVRSPGTGGHPREAGRPPKVPSRDFH